MKLHKHKLRIGVILAISIVVVSLIFHLKSPTYTRSLAEDHGGLFSPKPERESKWQLWIERLVGNCYQFDEALSICISNNNLTDDKIAQIHETGYINNMCIESQRISDISISFFTDKLRVYKLTVSSNKISDSAFGDLSKISGLSNLALISDAITGSEVTKLSTSGIRTLYIKSDNLNHSMISRSNFPKTLEEIGLIGPPVSTEDYLRYVSNLPEGCRVRLTSPLPKVSSQQKMSKNIDLNIAIWDSFNGKECSCQ